MYYLFIKQRAYEILIRSEFNRTIVIFYFNIRNFGILVYKVSHVFCQFSQINPQIILTAGFIHLNLQEQIPRNPGCQELQSFAGVSDRILFCEY
jgi:hypothetical protein